MLINHDQFFNHLEKSLSDDKNGTLFLSLKRYIPNATNMKRTFSALNQLQQDHTAIEYPCLVRVMKGKKTKFSTLVHPNETDEFMNRYAQILKLGINQHCCQPVHPNSLTDTS